MGVLKGKSILRISSRPAAENGGGNTNRTGSTTEYIPLSPAQCLQKPMSVSGLAPQYEFSGARARVFLQISSKSAAENGREYTEPGDSTIGPTENTLG